jgi:hypothetical protein
LHEEGLAHQDYPGYIRFGRYASMKKPTTKLNQFPRLRSDEEAERFVETADLTQYDWSGFKPVRFVFDEKTGVKMIPVNKETTSRRK